MALLEIEDLAVAFGPAATAASVVDGVGFTVDAHETVALVGESGSGKSVTALAIMRLLQEPGRVTRGAIRFEGRDISHYGEREMAAIRGNRIAMIFQEPMSSLNPLLSIGAHVAEPLRLHRGLSRRDARAQATALLDRVGIPSAAQRYDDYPHRMSGGMRPRVMIAAALACEPALLIADEPTTALDVTIQAQILELMQEMKERFGMAIMLITHAMGVVAETCQRVTVMYAGNVVEEASVEALFGDPRHPYTQGLIRSIPRVDRSAEKKQRLEAIAGTVPNLLDPPPGCRFAARCKFAMDVCSQGLPPLKEVGPGHYVRCVL